MFAEYVAREKSVQDERLNNLNNQLYILGQQIEQKEQETIELNAKIRTVSRSVDLARQELNISRPLAKEGIVPQVELIKLERQVNEMQGELEANRLLGGDADLRIGRAGACHVHAPGSCSQGGRPPHSGLVRGRRTKRRLRAGGADGHDGR